MNRTKTTKKLLMMVTLSVVTLVLGGCGRTGAGVSTLGAVGATLGSLGSVAGALDAASRNPANIPLAGSRILDLASTVGRVF